MPRSPGICDAKGGARSSWPAMLLLAVVSAAVLLPGLGSAPLVDPDESRCAMIAGEMLRSGQWLMPHLEGAIYWDKPAPFFWLAAGGQWLTGSIELGGRLVAVMAAAATVLVAFLWARRLAGVRAGLLAGVVLVTSMMFVQMARWYRMDMPLAACIVAAIWWYWRYELPRRESPWRWVGFYVFCALACLMKGPAGLGMPVLVIVGYLLLIRQARRVKEFFNFWGIVTFVLIAMPWYVAVCFRYPSYFNEFIMQQNVARLTTGKYDKTLFGVGYLAILLCGMMPWMVFLADAVGLVRPARRGPHPLRRRYARLKTATQADRRGFAGRVLFKSRLMWRVVTWRARCMEQGKLFVCLAVLIPLAILCAAKTQMAPYILPLFAPMAVLLGLAAYAWLTRKGEWTKADRRLTRGVMILLIVVLAVLAVIDVVVPAAIEALEGIERINTGVLMAALRRMKLGAGWLDGSMVAAAVGLVAAVAAMFVAIARKRRGMFLSAATVGVVVVLTFGLMPLLGRFYEGSSLRTLMANLPNDAPAGRQLCSWGSVRHSASLYAGLPWIVRLDPDYTPPDLLAKFLSQPGTYCLWSDAKGSPVPVYYIEFGQFERLVQDKYHATVQTLGKDRNYRLIRISTSQPVSN